MKQIKGEAAAAAAQPGYGTEFHPWPTSKTAKSLHVVIHTRTIPCNSNPKENYLERPYTSDLVLLVKGPGLGGGGCYDTP